MIFNTQVGKENLDAELTAQDNLIAQIATALEGKTAGGGGSALETCTVTITEVTGSDIEMNYLSADGELKQIAASGSSVTIETIVNAPIAFRYGYSAAWFNQSDTFMILSGEYSNGGSIAFSGNGFVSVAY